MCVFYYQCVGLRDWGYCTVVLLCASVFIVCCNRHPSCCVCWLGATCCCRLLVVDEGSPESSGVWAAEMHRYY